MMNNETEHIKHWHLYVLKLEQDKWYVGITSKTPKTRFLQHKAGFAGAAWTKIYKPLKIHDTKDLGRVSINEAQRFEGRVTRKYMEEYGDNNVRGGDLTDTGEYIKRFGWFWPKDNWETLTIMILELAIIAYLLMDKYFIFPATHIILHK